jgi:hypothetical protein
MNAIKKVLQEPILKEKEEGEDKNESYKTTSSDTDSNASDSDDSDLNDEGSDYVADENIIQLDVSNIVISQELKHISTILQLLTIGFYFYLFIRFGEFIAQNIHSFRKLQ